MSLSKQTLTRLPKIKAGLIKKLSRETIGKQCFVTEKTIDRDIGKWVQTSDFEQWLKELWLQEYYKIDDVEVFRAVTKLLAKMITQKVEAKTEYKEEIRRELTININELPEDERKLLEHAARVYIKSSGKEQPHNIH